MNEGMVDAAWGAFYVLLSQISQLPYVTWQDHKARIEAKAAEFGCSDELMAFVGLFAGDYGMDMPSEEVQIEKARKHLEG